MKIVYRESIGVFWVRHLLQRIVKRLRKKDPVAIKICAFPDDQIGRDIAVSGIYEAAGISAIKWLIQSNLISSSKGGVFVDVGANVGVYSLSLASHFKKVIAFEPHPVTNKILDLNVYINRIENIVISNCGLSDKSGMATLVDDLNNTGASSINKTAKEDDISYEVEIKQSSDAIMELMDSDTYISLVKIDVEGHELSVINGLLKLLQTGTPIIAFEANNAEVNSNVLALLKSNGYEKFIALDYWPTSSFIWVRTLLLTCFGVRYVLRDVDHLEHKNFSLVFALGRAAYQKWNELR